MHFLRGQILQHCAHLWLFMWLKEWEMEDLSSQEVNGQEGM